MAPLILYAIFGSSRALAVGPVAVASLMTAAAAGQLASQGTPEYLGAAIALAMVSGLLLIAMGFLKLGFLANFLSHPVIAGFITASGLQIAAGQLGPVLGIHAEGESFLDIVISLWHTISWYSSYYRSYRYRFTYLSLLGTQRTEASAGSVWNGRQRWQIFL
ncbi:MAG: SulP family inorganic anion transporter [Marinilabiliales bacterium]|nr:SulP family inorganic anion transporter [Marinilabiliales bacterium]